MMQSNDFTREDWLNMCKRAYKALRNDDPVQAIGILEGDGFSLDDLEEG